MQNWLQSLLFLLSICFSHTINAETVETIVKDINKLTIKHLSTWKAVNSIEQAKMATKSSKDHSKSIKKLISKLKKQPRPSAKERELLTTIIEKNLILLNSTWDQVDAKLQKNKTLLPFYLKANNHLQQELDQHMPTVYKWIGTDELIASE